MITTILQGIIDKINHNEIESYNFYKNAKPSIPELDSLNENSRKAFLDKANHDYKEAVGKGRSEFLDKLDKERVIN